MTKSFGKKIKEVSETLPDGLKLSVSFDRATYIKEAIQMCYRSIILALANPAWRPDNDEMKNVTFNDYDWKKWKKT